MPGWLDPALPINSARIIFSAREHPLRLYPDDIESQDSASSYLCSPIRLHKPGSIPYGHYRIYNNNRCPRDPNRGQSSRTLFL